jgi:outer membrane protein
MKLLTVITILALQSGITSAQDTLTLDRVINAALEHNHNLRISEIETVMADNQVTRGNAGQLPSLFVTSGLNWSYTDMELTPGSFFQNLANPGGDPQQPAPVIEFDGVSATNFNAALGTQFVIYNGLKGRLRFRILESGSKLARLQHRLEMENTLLIVTEKYLMVASLQQAVALRKITLEQSLDRYRMMEARHSYGQANEQQRLQALADLKSDSTEFRNLSLQYENAYRELHRVIGWELREIVPVDEKPGLQQIPHYDDLLTALAENNTLLNVRRQRIEHAGVGLSLSKANFLPQLSASAQYGYSFMQATDGQFESQKQMGFSGGVSLRIPIFTGGQSRTVSQNAQAIIRQEQLRYEESEQELRVHFDNIWFQLHHLEDQLATMQSNLEVYKRNYERAQELFSQGLISGLELRSAQLSLQHARLHLTETDYQIRRVATNLFYISGLLVQLKDG